MKKEMKLVNINLSKKTILDFNYVLTENDSIKLDQDLLYIDIPVYLKELGKETCSYYYFLSDFFKSIENFRLEKNQLHKLTLKTDKYNITVDFVPSRTDDLKNLFSPAVKSLHRNLYNKNEKISGFRVFVEASTNLTQELKRVNNIFNSRLGKYEIFKTEDAELLKNVITDYEVKNIQYDIDSDMYFFSVDNKMNLFSEGKWVENIFVKK